MKAGIFPFNPGIMLAADGVNHKSSADPERELRKRSAAIHITSTELTDPAFIEKLKEYKTAHPQTKRNKTTSGIFGKSYNFKDIINSHNLLMDKKANENSNAGEKVHVTEVISPEDI